MKFGAWLIQTDEGPDPIRTAQEAEELGFESFWCSDHTHIPVADLPRSPQPPYGPLPREYFRIMDPFVVLAAIAASTTKIKLGTSVCIVPQRDPIVLAKQIATLDRLSDGRVLFGAGAGWHGPELANHGVDPARRMVNFRERIEAMQKIWDNDEAEYHGSFIDFDPIFSWPKPAQPGGPPVLIGGSGRNVIDRVLKFGDGWIPGDQRDLGALGARISELHNRASASGDEPPPVSIVLARPERVAEYERIGAERCVFMLRTEREDARVELGKLAESLDLVA